jgi:methionine aminopeptidase
MIGTCGVCANRCSFLSDGTGPGAGQVKGRTIEKGVAFPTCVSVNECVCHNSPLNSEAQVPSLRV